MAENDQQAPSYTQERNAAAASGLEIAQQLVQLRESEAAIMRAMSASQDPVLMQQFFEDLSDIRGEITKKKREATRPPAPAPQAPEGKTEPAIEGTWDERAAAAEREAGMAEALQSVAEEQYSQVGRDQMSAEQDPRGQETREMVRREILPIPEEIRESLMPREGARDYRGRQPSREMIEASEEPE